MAALDLLFDTNVLIYGLEGRRLSSVNLLTELAPLEGAISVVTWIEMLVGAADATRTRHLLSRFTLISLDSRVVEETVRLRRTTRLKLPDAIIYASALATGRTLVTYNTRDFPPGTPFVFCPAA